MQDPTPLNPFRFGKPVPPKKLIGRAAPIQTLVSNLHLRATTLISGLPHIGKSSLLVYIADENVRAEKLKDLDQELHWQDFDCHLLPLDFTPTDFWERLFSQLEADSRAEKLKTKIQHLRSQKFSSFELQMFFKQCAYLPLTVVLMIDEFETLVSHPGFKDMQFFRTLRTLVYKTDGLMLIAASRLRLAKLHDNIREHLDGSPVFNNLSEVCLPPLEIREVEQLLDQSLAETRVEFNSARRDLVARLAGRHPYLVQVAASAVFDAVQLTGDLESQVRTATELFRDRSDGFFSDLWRYLEPEAQLALVILSLAEVHGHVHDRDYNTRDATHLDWYTPELDKLASLGLIERQDDCIRNPDDKFVFWQQQNWRFSAAGMAEWILNNPVSTARQKDSFDQWLQRNQFEGLVTHEQKEKFHSLIKSLPDSFWHQAGTFIGSIAKNFLGVLGKGAGSSD